MRIKLQTVLRVIIATAVLHNMACDMLEDEPPLPENVEADDLNYLIQMGDIDDVPNQNENVLPDHFRNSLINNYFAQL